MKNLKIKTFVVKNIVATLRIDLPTKEGYLGYQYIFSQDEVEYDGNEVIINKIVDKVKKYCFKKDINLISY